MKIKAKIVMVSIAVGALAFTSLLSVYQLFVRDCLFWTCAPERSFSVLDLDLPLMLFPDGAIGNHIHSPSTREGAVESGIMTIHWQEGKGGAVYNVWKFGTINHAIKFYNTLINDEFYPEHGNLSYKSHIADDFVTGCGSSEFGSYRCRLVARYEEFTLSINATVDEKMTVEQFEQLAIFIDDQMSFRLNSRPASGKSSKILVLALASSPSPFSYLLWVGGAHGRSRFTHLAFVTPLNSQKTLSNYSKRT